MLKTEERTHSKFSPSTWPYLAQCPSYRKEPGGTNPIAELGTLAHKAVETRDLTGLDEKYQKAVRECIDLEDSLVGSATEILTEPQLQILNQKGFLDKVIIHDRSAYILDWKFGWTAVAPAISNWQGFGYLIGVWDAYPEISSITVLFFMPFLKIRTEHTFERDADYARIKLSAEKLLRDAEEAKIQTPGDYCLYCGVRATCRALAEKMSLVVQNYDSLTLPAEFHSSQITDPAQMALALNVAAVAEKWSASVKEHAKEFALQGHKIPGFELAERAGAREIKNVPVAWDILKGYVDESALLSTVKINYGELEKLISERAPKGTKSKTLLALEATLTEEDALERRAPVQFLKKTKKQTLETINI